MLLKVYSFASYHLTSKTDSTSLRNSTEPKNPFLNISGIPPSGAPVVNWALAPRSGASDSPSLTVLPLWGEKGHSHSISVNVVRQRIAGSVVEQEP